MMPDNGKQKMPFGDESTGLEALGNFFASLPQDPGATHPAARAPDMIGAVGNYIGGRMMAPITVPMQGIGYLKDLTQRAMGGEDISTDPTAGGQMLRGLQSLGAVGSAVTGGGPGGASLRAVLGPELNRESMRRLGMSETAPMSEFQHHLIDPNTGRKTGTISISRKPSPRNPAEDIAYIEGVYGNRGAGQEGFGGTKELLRSIQQEYPWATGVGGFRVSGGRGAAGRPEDAMMYFSGKRFDPTKAPPSELTPPGRRLSSYLEDTPFRPAARRQPLPLPEERPRSSMTDNQFNEILESMGIPMSTSRPSLSPTPLTSMPLTLPIPPVRQKLDEIRQAFGFSPRGFE